MRFRLDDAVTFVHLYANAVDVSHHLVYVGAAALVFELFDRRQAQQR